MVLMENPTEDPTPVDQTLELPTTCGISLGSQAFGTITCLLPRGDQHKFHCGFSPKFGSLLVFDDGGNVVFVGD